jgi:hypothetical protein
MHCSRFHSDIRFLTRLAVHGRETSHNRIMPLFYALVLAIASSATARTWHVQVGGGGDVSTIQAGIDSAVTGDSVVVGAGLYDENLSMQGKSLVLRSLSGADVTVIDGGARNRVLAMSAGVVEGFTLQRGACDLCDGAGILIFPPGPAVIRNCIIQNNVAGFGPKGGTGGGVFMAAPTLVENNVVRENFAGTAGGGLYDYTDDRSTVVRNNIIKGNSTYLGGGGLYGGLTQVLNNLFVDNSSAGGGGAIQDCSEIRGNTIVRNSGGAAGGIFSGARISHNIVALNQGVGVRLVSAPVYPDCNNIWGNTTNVANWSGTGSGNFSADPLFCNAPIDDFTLNRESPCLPDGSAGCSLVGAFLAGCGTTAVQPASWGHIKGLYR